MQLKEKINSELQIPFLKAFKEGLEYLTTIEKSSKPNYFPSWPEFHTNTPKLTLDENGFYKFNNDNNLIRHSSPLYNEGKYLEVESWQEFQRKFMAIKELCHYYKLTKEFFYSDLRSDLDKKIHTFGLLDSCINHYIHQYNTKKFNLERAERIFHSWLVTVSTKELFFEICIPIFGLDFEFNKFKIGKGIIIRKIKDGNQFSRMCNIQTGQHNWTEQKMISFCKYEISLEFWSVKQEHHDDSYNSFQNLNLNKEFEKTINLLLGLISLYPNIKTGYYQVYAIPLIWNLGYIGKQKEVLKTYIESFPANLKNGISFATPCKVNPTQIKEAKKLYNLLVTEKNNKADKEWKRKLKFCIRKIYESGLRLKDSDKILDLTIVLESLLTFASPNEITHKLSTNGAYLTKLFPFQQFTPFDIKSMLTKVYKLRSLIVHAAKEESIDKAKTSNFKDEEISLLEFLNDFVKHVLKLMIKHEDLRDIKNLEKTILENAS